MAIEIKQGLRISQQLLMTPQLQQAIKLLKLSRVELEEFVAEQLSENPVLEEGIIESSEEKMQVEKEKESSEENINTDYMGEGTKIVDRMGEGEKENFDWEAYSRDHDVQAMPQNLARHSGEETPNYENFVSKSKTLQEHLMTQLGELDLDENEIGIAQNILGNLDDNGYLQTSSEEIASQLQVDPELVDDVLDTVQRLDPIGVASRDLKECLLIQLRALRLKNGIVEKIIENHLSDLENKNYNAIARALKIDLKKVEENLGIIADLEPIPGRQFSEDATQYIIPDVYVFKLANEWVVSLNEEGLPRLKVSSFYQDKIQEAKHVAQPKEKEYVQERVKSAQWLIRSIQQRQKTIFKVAESIVRRQKDFFEYGIKYLRPMVLNDVAQEIEMSDSTVSRVTSNKYMHTPRGIFELKFFFNSSVAGTDGDFLASESVKVMIDEIIKSEDARKPYSDKKIVDVLEEKGVHLARRTVAKYRENLGIHPSSKRKKIS